MLEVGSLTASYGLHPVLHDVSITVPDGRIVTVIGTNGAGKTTLVNAVMGLVPRVRGSVRLDGVEVSGRPAHTRPRDGIALVPEGRRVFAPLSVLENLRLGAYSVEDRERAYGEVLEQVFELFPRLRERQGQAAGTLSGGEQQMLAIGRALMTSPTVLLLDEPSLGLAPLVIDQIFDTLAELNRTRGLALLLIEQNAAEALALADHAYVLDGGRVILEGPAEALADDPAVQRAYLSIDDSGVVAGS